LAQGIWHCIPVLLLFLAASPAHTEITARPPTQGERDFYASASLPAIRTVKKAMPPAPAGWVVAKETSIDPMPELVSDAMQYLRFAYHITYKRVVGVKDEKKKLDDAYAESSRQRREAAKPLIDELIKQQTETSLALQKATRRRDHAGEKRLNDELDENGLKMRAVHEDVEKKVNQDIEPYLVKDAEVSLQISVNDEGPMILRGESVSVPQAAFAFRSDGARTGPLAWKEGRTVVLFGAWRQEKENVFRAAEKVPLQDPRVRTIMVTLTGDQARAEQLFKQMNVKALLSLME
jgi:hypothetical protein